MPPDFRISGQSLVPAAEGTASDSLSPVSHAQATAAEAVLSLGTRQNRVRAANLRDQVHLLAVDTVGVHHHAQEQDLHVMAETKARKGVRALLHELAVDRGMSWSSIARLVGVSVGAIRKWRHDGSASGENRRALGRLAAVLDLLDSFAIHDPGGWLEMPLVEGYTVTGIDVYRVRQERVLLDYASHRISVEELLDQFDAQWRITCRTNFEVFEADDGMLAIRGRQGISDGNS